MSQEKATFTTQLQSLQLFYL